jgi:hypothetical protein
LGTSTINRDPFGEIISLTISRSKIQKSIVTWRKLMTNFETFAQKYGHDVAALEAGKESERQINVEDINGLRELLTDSESGPAMNATASAEKSTSSDLAARAQAFVMGGAPLSDADQKAVAGLFPMAVNSVLTPKLDLKTVMDLGTSVAPYTWHIQELNIYPGGAIRIQNSILKLTIDNLTMVGGAPVSGSVNYHLGIFGATGQTGQAIQAPSQAPSGSTGRNADCSVSGSEPGQPSSAGLTGAKGSTGSVGNPGGAGLSSLSATIQIGGMTGGQFVIKTVSGTGGRGGTGGQGQQGGNGGRGGNGIRCECTGVDASDGGKAGSGGRGGTGGTGGRAVSGSDVYVSVPPGLNQLIARIRNSAPTGAPGPGGPLGKAGSPGGPGAGDKHSTAGATGGVGADGADGHPGAQGPGAEGAPGQIYVNGSTQ